MLNPAWSLLAAVLFGSAVLPARANVVIATLNASLDSGTLLNSETRRQMWTPARLNNGAVTQYGFGWRIEQFQGHLNIGHGGSTSGFSATIQRFPDDELTVILLTNTDEQIAAALARKVAALYFVDRSPR